MSMETLDIIVAGVGGQGNLVCGKVLAEAAVSQGKKPIIGDTFGASRRGGSVLTHLRISDADLGPLIPRGSVDIILGMEPVESLRQAIEYASKDAKMVFSVAPVQSAATRSGAIKYPNIDRLIEACRDLVGGVFTVDPTQVLQRIGTYRVLNVFMLGYLAGLDLTPFSNEEIKQGIQKVVGHSEANLDAFSAGIDAGKELEN